MRKPKGFKKIGVRREHCVSVRFSDDELKVLSAAAGEMQRGTYLRELWLHRVIAPIPEANKQIWREASIYQATLNQLVTLLRARNLDPAEAQEAFKLIRKIRLALIGVKDEVQSSRG